MAPLLRERRERAIRGVEWAVRRVEDLERRGQRMKPYQELALMAHAFVLGARGSRDGRISKADAERAANELLDTGSVGELGVRLYVKLTDGVIGSGGGGWAVGFEDDDGREDTPRVVLP